MAQDLVDKEPLVTRLIFEDCLADLRDGTPPFAGLSLTPIRPEVDVALGVPEAGIGPGTSASKAGICPSPGSRPQPFLFSKYPTGAFSGAPLVQAPLDAGVCETPRPTGVKGQ